MRINSCNDVQSWRIGKGLYLGFYEYLKNSKDYIFNDQLLRATSSITNNMTEGFDRASDKELKQFLIVSRAYSAEVRYLSHITCADKKLNKQSRHKYEDMTIDILKFLIGFIKKLTINNKLQAARP